MKFHNEHIPVLFNETIEMLNLTSGDCVVDGTFGGGGHAQAILERIGKDGLLIAIDRDQDAIERARCRFGSEPNLRIVHANFGQIHEVLAEVGVPGVNAALLDLGLSSYQLEDAERGFSYMQNAPLDMRMDRTQRLSARDIVNSYSQERLAKVLRQYGEERWAERIANFIVKTRAAGTIESTGQLVEIVKAAIPTGARRDGPHPAKRTFQALRIEVNDELSELADNIDAYIDVLYPGGRLAVITFHSLEDRVVKQEFKKLQDPCECPKDFPVCVCGKQPQIRIVTRKPMLATADELKQNPRARSAKLRVAQKI